MNILKQQMPINIFVGKLIWSFFKIYIPQQINSNQ